jgi:cytidine deaminase
MADSPRTKALLEAAREARENAYSPYSGVKIGAAVVTSKGKIFTGCNVENSSYGLSCCAERTAIFKSISVGCRDIVAIAVVGETKEFTTPCGACRQVMVEFNPEMRVLRRGINGFFVETTAGALLPSRFSPKELSNE